jgi:hypothetical protein
VASGVDSALAVVPETNTETIAVAKSQAARPRFGALFPDLRVIVISFVKNNYFVTAIIENKKGVSSLLFSNSSRQYYDYNRLFVTLRRSTRRNFPKLVLRVPVLVWRS